MTSQNPVTTISLNLFNTFHPVRSTALLHFLSGADMSIRQTRVGVRRPVVFDNCIYEQIERADPCAAPPFRKEYGKIKNVFCRSNPRIM